MSRSPRDRPSAAEKKERQGCTGPVDCGKAVPATSADLVNRPQDFSLGSRGDGRRCSVLNFNVRASLFVGPRLSVVFPQGVQGAPWRHHAQLPASDPCGRTCRNFATCRTTSSMVPSRPDAGPMAPWQEIPQTLPAVRSTWLSRQPTTSKMMLGLVYSGCPRSCLMAHSDSGHPSVLVPRTHCTNLP